MGDIWPYGPPHYEAWSVARDWLLHWGMPSSDGPIGAAIMEAESSIDTTVINDTPSTGDYSVGAAQVNYYGSLYAERVGKFGTPRQLIQGGISAQAKAMVTLWKESGFRPWSTFNDGAYKKYLHGSPVPVFGPGQKTAPIDTTIEPPTEDYSATVRAGAASVHNLGITYANAATVLRKLRG